jgi:hypothetical protein
MFGHTVLVKGREITEGKRKHLPSTLEDDSRCWINIGGHSAIDSPHLFDELI